jgi:hypothetical protein
MSVGRTSESMKAQWNTPTSRKKMIAGIKKATRSIVAREKQSKRSKRYWKDPKIRLNMLRSIAAMQKKRWPKISSKQRFLGHVKIRIGKCWIWFGSKDPCGYGRFLFDGKNRTTHRVSWLIYKGDIPDGLQVLHRCDTPSCVNPAHLFLGTQKDNMQDCKRKGRTGKKGAKRKLSDEQITKIRKTKTPIERHKLAFLFGVSKGYVQTLFYRHTKR